MVLQCSAVHAFEYYDSMAADAKRLVDKARRSVTRERKAARDGLGYYDHAADDGVGIFERLTRSGVDPSSLFAAIASGSVAETTIIRRLAQRRHPLTGRQLPLAHKQRWLKGKRKHAQQVVGHDIQISAPKSVSVLYAFASPALRIMIADAHHRSVATILAFTRDNGLITTRSGRDGWREEAVEDSLIARYFHRLSRANDPHLHSHCVLMNVCSRADGSVGAVDTKKIVAFSVAMTELYRAELASILHRELGLEVKQDTHGFSLPAIPETVIDLFSKRRTAIVEEAEARSFEAAHDRKAAQKVANATRQSKVKGITAESRRADWEAEARAFGCDPASFMPAIEAACAAYEPSLPPVHALEAYDRPALIEAAFAHDSQLSWPKFLARIARQVQIDANAEETVALAEELRGHLIALPNHDQGEKVYTTATVIKAEHKLFRSAIGGRSRWTSLTRSQVETGLDGYASLSSEQRSAVLHALNRDRVAIVNGSAGAGKSFMARAIASVAGQHGIHVLGVSAAWTAAHVLRREAELMTENTFSLAKLAADLASGNVVLDEKCVLIVDEAGMAPLVAIADLVRLVDDAGAKIVLIGDVRQLQPVAFGAPMRALARELGYAELALIRRQRHEWMREASVNLAAHRPEAAIDAYDEAGFLIVHPDRPATLAAAAADYMLQAAGIPANTALRDQLLITARNRDVVDLNRLVREQLQSRGMIGPDVLHIRAVPRGKRETAEPVDLDLAVGDRIIFGSRLEIGPRIIFNSDVARITSLDPNGDNPRLTFVLDRTADNGQPLSFMARYRDLISSFDEAKVPAIQHAYAVTVHASQGATVERSILVDVEGLGAEAAYVGMTRHRDYLSLHINAQKSLSRHRREVARLSRRNELLDAAEMDRSSIIITTQERNAALQDAKARARRPQADQNPSSHVFDMGAWLNSSDPVAEFQRQAKPHGRRGTSGRLEPFSPTIASFGDPTVLSSAEIAHLDAIPIISEPVLKAYDLVESTPGTLSHVLSGKSIAVNEDRPLWSDKQAEELHRRRGTHEHPLVQMALLLLSKPLRWARAWVRRRFGMQELNPLATAAHRTERGLQEQSAAIQASQPLDLERATIEPDNVEGNRRLARHKRRFKLWEALDQEYAEHFLPALSATETQRNSPTVDREATGARARRHVDQPDIGDGRTATAPSVEAPATASLLPPASSDFLQDGPSARSGMLAAGSPKSGEHTSAYSDQSMTAASRSEPTFAQPWMSDDDDGDEARATRHLRSLRRQATWERWERRERDKQESAGASTTSTQGPDVRLTTDKSDTVSLHHPVVAPAETRPSAGSKAIPPEGLSSVEAGSATAESELPSISPQSQHASDQLQAQTHSRSPSARKARPKSALQAGLEELERRFPTFTEGDVVAVSSPQLRSLGDERHDHDRFWPDTPGAENPAEDSPPRKIKRGGPRRNDNGIG